MALPPPPPPPSFVDPHKVYDQPTETETSNTKADKKVPKGGGDKKSDIIDPESTEPDATDPNELKEEEVPVPEIYCRDEKLVARCFFLQGAEEGGVGRRDCGVERMGLHMTAFAIWRPASNGTPSPQYHIISHSRISLIYLSR